MKTAEMMNKVENALRTGQKIEDIQDDLGMTASDMYSVLLELVWAKRIKVEVA